MKYVTYTNIYTVYVNFKAKYNVNIMNHLASLRNRSWSLTFKITCGGRIATATGGGRTRGSPSGRATLRLVSLEAREANRWPTALRQAPTARSSLMSLLPPCGFLMEGGAERRPSEGEHATATESQAESPLSSDPSGSLNIAESKLETTKLPPANGHMNNLCFIHTVTYEASSH